MLQSNNDQNSLKVSISCSAIMELLKFFTVILFQSIHLDFTNACSESPCIDEMIGNAYCEEWNNIEECNYDNGMFISNNVPI